MSKKTFIYLIVILITNFFVFSCKKEAGNILPELKLKSSINYTTDKSYITAHQIKFGILAMGKEANITNLVIKCSGKDFTKTIFDGGYNTSILDIDKSFTNVWGDTLEWTLTVMDKNRNFNTLRLTTYDTSKIYATINHYQNIELGMQNNITLPQLLNASSGNIYSIAQGQQNAQLIDVLCYYYITSGTPSYTFSSAGDMDAPTYYPAISSFNPKNYTDWDYATQISVAAFDNCNNDSLLIAAFHSGAGFSSRKYKFADAGKVIPFKTAGGKTGLIKVISVSGIETGKIVFNLKIQK